jgi:hypothetical protein
MRLRILSLALALGLLALPTAAPAAASSEPAGSFDSAIVVSAADLPDLLASGLLGDYALVTPADIGLEEGALVGGALLTEDSVLTPSALGIDTPDQRFFPFVRFGGFSPFFRGFATVNGMISVMLGGGHTISTTLTNVQVPFFRFGSGFLPFFRSFGFSPFAMGRTLIVRVCC